MTVVDYIDLDDDGCYVEVDFVDLSTDEDSVEKDNNVEKDGKFARSENVANAAVTSLISEQDATPATSLSKLEQEQPATTSLPMLEHGATTSSVLVEETMRPDHQEFLATNDVSKEATRFGNHGLIAVGYFGAEAMQSEHEAEAFVFSSLREQGAITSSLREHRAMQSGNQVLVAAVCCTEEATQSENTATAAGSPSMTEIGSTCKSRCVGQLCQMIGYPSILEDTGNAMGSTGICNRHAQEEPEEDTEKDETCDFETEPEALCQDVSLDVFALSLSPQDKEKEISQFRKFYSRKGNKQVNTSATECNRQLNLVHAKGELPTLHNGDSGFSVMGNVRNGTASIGMNVLDGEVLASTYEECNNTSLGNATYGKVRDTGSKGCMVEDCTNGAHGGSSLCTFHNSRPLKRCCAVIGCTSAACTSSQGRTDRCVKHGGGKRCKYDGCGKGAQGITDYCIAHGGGRRCKFQGCRKGAQGRSYCIEHGGGRRCKFLGCHASATYAQDLCSMHRTCMLSGNNSAHEILPTPAPARRAKKAESSKRRNSHTVIGGIGGRSQKRQHTNDYVETEEEKGRVFICQNNMPKAQETTHRMNSDGLAEDSPPRKFKKLAEVYT